MFPDLFRDDVFMLETPRLFLRWPKAGDAAQIVALAGNRRVAEMTAHIPHPYPPELATKFILSTRAMNADGLGLGLAITERGAPRTLIGMIGIRRGPTGEATIGYWIGESHWGRGLVTEAAQALIDALFLYTEEREVVASIGVTNVASRKVLEHCGFQYDGGSMCPREAWGDCVPSDSYRLARPLWLSLKGWRAPIPFARGELAESA